MTSYHYIQKLIDLLTYIDELHCSNIAGWILQGVLIDLPTIDSHIYLISYFWYWNFNLSTWFIVSLVCWHWICILHQLLASNCKNCLRYSFSKQNKQYMILNYQILYAGFKQNNLRLRCVHQTMLHNQMEKLDRFHNLFCQLRILLYKFLQLFFALTRIAIGMVKMPLLNLFLLKPHEIIHIQIELDTWVMDLLLLP